MSSSTATCGSAVGGVGSNAAAAGDFDDEREDDELDDDVEEGEKRSRRETLPDIAKRIPVDALRPYLRMPLLSAAKVRCDADVCT